MNEIQSQEAIDAQMFGISIEQLRQQRIELGQLTDGKYQGCSPLFARATEAVLLVDKLMKS